MKPEHLYNAGAALYGQRWQRALAVELGVSEAAVRFWVQGTRTMPQNLRDRVAALLAERIRELQFAKAKLPRRGRRQSLGFFSGA